LDNYKTIIELGSFSIKSIIYSEYNGDFQIIGTGKSKTYGYNGNEIENFDDFIDCIKNSLVQAEKQANFVIKDAYLLMTNRSVNVNKIIKTLIKYYKKNEFIKIMKKNNQLGSGNVLNTNNCEISVCETRIKNKFIIFSAIDNLVKGASGQAVQNMNVIFRFPENLGLK